MTILEGFYPAQGRLFIRHIETEERYAGGLIIVPDQARDKIAKQQFIVVSLGDYEHCDDPEECNRPHHKGFLHKHHLKVGDWILARNRAWLDTPDPTLYVLNQRDVFAIFRERSDAAVAHDPDLRPDRDVSSATGR